MSDLVSLRHLTPTAKPWGNVFGVPTGRDRVRIDLLAIKSGGHSSVHRHRVNFNEFIVSEGVLTVWVFDQPRPERPTRNLTLSAGDRLIVPPGVWHQFLAETDCTVCELYYRDDEHPVGDDIERLP
jgi:quercetin dioxygenase-like cupin family protein